MTSSAASPSQALVPSEPAVLLLIFNRPDLTARTLAAIREAKPRRLYVAADGPRPGHATDGAKCRECRELIQTIDWPCEVFTLLRQHNLGCSHAITDGIDWFFSQEHEGIILEDDCLPSPAFFSWCKYALDRFREDSRIVMVSGTPFEEKCGDDDVVRLTRYTSIWGWASWHDRWTRYRREAEYLSVRAVRSKCDYSDEAAYWEERYHLAFHGSWDYRLCIYALGNGFLTAIPPIRLVANQATVHGPLSLPPAALKGFAWESMIVCEDAAYDRRAFENVFCAAHMHRSLSRWGRMYVRLRTLAASADSPLILKWFDAIWRAAHSLKRFSGQRASTGK